MITCKDSILYEWGRWGEGKSSIVILLNLLNVSNKLQGTFIFFHTKEKAVLSVFVKFSQISQISRFTENSKLDFFRLEGESHQ